MYLFGTAKKETLFYGIELEYTFFKNSIVSRLNLKLFCGFNALCPFHFFRATYMKTRETVQQSKIFLYELY